MTARTIPNATYNGITIYTIKVEEIINKKIEKITPATSSAKWGAGPKSTKIVDLLRIEERFVVDGTIASTDKASLKSSIKAGGVKNFVWDGTTYAANIEKIQIIEGGNGEQDDIVIKATLVVGEDV